MSKIKYRNTSDMASRMAKSACQQLDALSWTFNVYYTDSWFPEDESR